jgi:hypothetical protein
MWEVLGMTMRMYQSSTRNQSWVIIQVVLCLPLLLTLATCFHNAHACWVLDAKIKDKKRRCTCLLGPRCKNQGWEEKLAHLVCLDVEASWCFLLKLLDVFFKVLEGEVTFHLAWSKKALDWMTFEMRGPIHSGKPVHKTFEFLKFCTLCYFIPLLVALSLLWTLLKFLHSLDRHIFAKVLQFSSVFGFRPRHQGPYQSPICFGP